MRVRWSEPEIEKAESLIGNVATCDLEAKYNRWAKKHGYPPRTKRAIDHLASKLGLSLLPDGDYVTTGYISRMLGISIYAPQRWVEDNLVEHKRRGKGKYAYISRKNLRGLARRKPYLFAGCSRENLYALLESEELAEEISENYRTRGLCFTPINQQRLVHAVGTNLIFSSVGQAAKAVYVRRQVISRAIQRNWKAAGYHWEYVQ